MTPESNRHGPPAARDGGASEPPAARDALPPEAQSHPKVVARFLDGRVVKGFALEFRPSQREILLMPRAAADPQTSVRIHLADLKALFFVKDFDGDPAWQQSADADRSSLLGQKACVRFRDGELLRGTTPSRDLGGAGFFLVPMDPRGNNRRVYVVAENALECRIE